MLVGCLIKYTDLQNDTKNDWKRDYVDKRGWIITRESHNLSPGKQWVSFYTFEGKQLHTSVGDAEYNENFLTITTKNSIYIFKIDKEVI